VLKEIIIGVKFTLTVTTYVLLINTQLVSIKVHTAHAMQKQKSKP